MERLSGTAERADPNRRFSKIVSVLLPNNFWLTLIDFAPREHEGKPIKERQKLSTQNHLVS